MKTNNLVRLTLITIGYLLSSSFTISAAEPTQQTQGIFATQGNCNEIDLNFVPGNGSRRIVVGHANSNVSDFPNDFNGYSSGSLFGTGSNLGNNNYIVYSGSGNSVTVTGLTGGTEYYFAVFEYNGTGNSANYLISNYPEANAIALGISMSISSSSGDMCAGDSVRLEAHGANTYLWNHTSSLSSATDSTVWAKPLSTTTYTVLGYDTAGCSDNLNVTVTVYSRPTVNLPSISSRCINGGTLTLSSGTPSGGTYSGAGVSGNQFNPNVAGAGLHVITYSYSDIHGCGNSDTSSIRVFSKPNASFPSLPDVCIDLAPFNFTTGTPVGGNYSGPGVTGGQLFNPATAGVGHHTVNYVYTNSNGCSDTSQSIQEVRVLPTVAFATLNPLCISTPQYSLTQGTPAGGVYSGTGVSNSVFSPQVTGPGSYVLTYTYTDSHSCSNHDTSVMTVNTLPFVSFSPIASVCANTGPVTLTGGNPTGGTYSGNSVGGTVFYTGIAGAGQHTINYSYTDSNSCTNTAAQTITVNAIPQPSLGNDISACADESVNLTCGTFTGYTWSTGSHNPSINVDTVNRGLGTFMITVTVSNSFNCINRDTILLTFDLCSGISTVEKNTLTVFPNPTSNEFTVLSDGKMEISVYDIKGTEIFSDYTSESVYHFGRQLSAGSYIVRVQRNGNSIYKLLIKQ